jgi:hypothetical protein
MPQSKFHTDDPQILGVTVENLVATATGAKDVYTPGYFNFVSSYAHHFDYCLVNSSPCL